MSARGGHVDAPVATPPGWPRALPRLLDAAFARAGIEVPASLAAWRDLATRGGPSPSNGPLMHDLVLPHAQGEQRVGLNLFRQPRDAGFALARAWTAQMLGANVARTLQAQLAVIPEAVEVAPGAHFSRNGAMLKLYFGAADRAALRPLATHLGVSASDRTRGLAVDLGPSGLTRAREYATLVPEDSALAALGPTAVRWRAARHDHVALRHCILESLDTWPAPGAKRSLVQTFAPDADIECVLGYEQSLREAGVVLPRPLDATWLRAIAAEMATTGLVLRVVAHEVDLFPDGRIDSDVFVGLGIASAAG